MCMLVFSIFQYLRQTDMRKAGGQAGVNRGGVQQIYFFSNNSPKMSAREMAGLSNDREIKIR